MADRGFPGPYVHEIKEMDPMMKRVPQDRTDIGGNSPSMPKSGTGGEMKISHVGEKAG